MTLKVVIQHFSQRVSAHALATRFLVQCLPRGPRIAAPRIVANLFDVLRSLTRFGQRHARVLAQYDLIARPIVSAVSINPTIERYAARTGAKCCNQSKARAPRIGQHARPVARQVKGSQYFQLGLAHRCVSKTAPRGWLAVHSSALHGTPMHSLSITSNLLDVVFQCLNGILGQELEPLQ